MRLQAAVDIRVRRLMSEKGFANFEEAAGYVSREDKARMSFVTANYGVRWDAAGLFDLVIDTGKIDPNLAADWLLEAVNDLPAVAASHGPSTRIIEVDEILAGTICDILQCRTVHEPQVIAPPT